MKKSFFLVLFLGAVCALFGQSKPRLAILPFTGGEGSDGQTIAMLLANQPEIRNVFTLVPRTSNVDAIVQERQFQQTGLTDSDTIASLGRLLNAEYVVAGHIRSLGESKLVLITIVNVESFQQIAGDYRRYTEIGEIRTYLPEMAKRLAGGAKVNTGNLPKLAVTPFAVPPGINAQDAEVLAQLLATEIANSGKYAVLPRTTTIEKAMEELKIQREGITDQNSIKAIGRATNAQYVLAGNVASLGSNLNLFLVQILDVESGALRIGSDREYRAIGDGLRLMAELSRDLTGVSSDPASMAYRRGEEYFAKKEWDRAIAEYNEAIRLNPDFGDAYFRRGYSYGVGKNNPDQAAADYARVTSLGSQYLNYAWNNLGIIAYNKNEYDSAIKCYTNAIGPGSTDALFYKNRGNAYYFGKKDYARAAADYTKVIELDPKDADSYFRRAYSYRQLKNDRQALADYNKYIELTPDDAMAYNNRGRIYFGSGMYDQAIADYTKAIALDSNKAMFYNNRAEAYEEKGENRKARNDRAAAERLK
jgi:tetratricopeptide (TPR) repeat protein